MIIDNKIYVCDDYSIYNNEKEEYEIINSVYDDIPKKHYIHYTYNEDEESFSEE